VDQRDSETWASRHRGATIYGAVTNLDELGWTHTDLFERLLDHPVNTAADIEGAFLIAAYDASENRYLLVTDKIGARPCYYSIEGPFRFASQVSTLSARLDSPSVDIQGVNDMLMMGHLWGERTLVEEIKAMRPATVMEIKDGDRSSERYWKPDYTEAEPGEEYLSELVRRYRQASERATRTFPEEAGIWLSGGLDSRTTAAALLEHRVPDGFSSLTAFTYDANPPTNDNPQIASSVCNKLGIEFVEVPLTPETFAPEFERVIESTDGMIAWNTLVNLSATYNIQNRPPVMLEGMQGELVGDHPFRYHLYRSGSVTQAQYDSEAGTSVETVDRLLNPDVDPYETFNLEAERTPETSHREKVLDIHFQNYYARHVLASNRVARERTGTRTVQADGEYLEWCARLPRRYRKGTFPLSRRFIKADAGGVPYGTSRAKLELCRRINPSLADITYERTKTKPKRPYPQHVIGFVANVIINRMLGNPTYGKESLSDIWLRDTSTELHDRVSELVETACSRPIFNDDVVEEKYEQHMDGENNVSILAKITTIEYWLQQHID
jgi:asparagine synthase (glutamine-hydrolysing)